MIETNGTYYLYRHIRLDTQTPVYIGIGKKMTTRHIHTTVYARAYSRQRNHIWKELMSVVDFEVEILLESNSPDFICQKEKEFISLYGRIWNGTGTLANMSSGGSGQTGYAASKETREKMRKAKLGTRHSEAHKLKSSNSIKLSWLSPNRKKPPPVSESTKKLLSFVKTGKPKKMPRLSQAHKDAISNGFTKKLTDEQILEAISLKESGMSARRIGRRFGTSHMTIDKSIKRYLKAIKSSHLKSKV